jgi:predicted P-loop ATPase
VPVGKDVTEWIQGGATKPSVEEVIKTAIAAPNDSSTRSTRSEDWSKHLLMTDTGAPRALLANAITALRLAPEWEGVLGFNEFSVATVALKAPPWSGGRAECDWTDHEDRLTADWMQHHGIYVSVEVAGLAIQTVAKDCSFHPVRERLNSLKWDGTKRIDGWLSLYLGVPPTPYANAVGSRWLISAVARIYEPGVKADCALILEGGQGLMKSTALKAIGEPWFTDEIADLGTKDAAMQTRGVWLIEIAELDSMSRAEVSKVKSFISRATDRFRPPYGKRLIESPRQCVFAGSVNQSTYLRDETGGRRFWPVTCTRILIDDLRRDRDQLWAEAVARYRQGEKWWLDTSELTFAAEQEQADRYEGDSWDEPIAGYVEDRESVSIEEVLRFLDKPVGTWTQYDKTRVARSLKALGWERYKAGSKHARQWRYRPQPVSHPGAVSQIVSQSEHESGSPEAYEM